MKDWDMTTIKKFFNELNLLNQSITEIEKDVNIPQFAQQMLRQMSALLQLAGPSLVIKFL